MTIFLADTELYQPAYLSLGTIDFDEGVDIGIGQDWLLRYRSLVR